MGDQSKLLVATPQDLEHRGLLVASAKDVAQLQCEQNKRDAAAREADKLVNLSTTRFFQDIGDCLAGVMDDLLNGRASLKDALTSPQRLRGLGFLVALFGVSGLIATAALG